jgi:hypothetical protein
MDIQEQFMYLIKNGSLQEIQEFYNNNPSIDISDDEMKDLLVGLVVKDI